jgi:hypothetical protein
MLFEQLAQCILEEGSLLAMAQGVAKRVEDKKLSAADGVKHLEDIYKHIKDLEEKKQVGELIKSLNK